MTELEDKIYQARCLSTRDHQDRLVEYRNFAHLLEERVKENPSKTFLSYYQPLDESKSPDFQKIEYSYQELQNKVAQTVNLLINAGLKKGDRIATVSHNHSETVIQYFAAWTIGLVIVPINVSEDPERISYILGNSHCKLAFVRDPYLAKIEALRKDLPELKDIICTGKEQNNNYQDFNSCNDLAETYYLSEEADLDSEALIVYTSGTTGNPKGVVLSHYNLLVDAKNISEWHKMDSEQKIMCVLPIHHVNGTIVTLVSPLYFGGSVLLNDKFRTSTFFKRIAEEQVNIVSVVPTLLAFLLEGNKTKNLTEELDLSKFRHIICGAGPLTVELAHDFEDTFKKRIVHGYGLSETTCYSCFLPISLSETEHQKWMRDYGFPSIGKALPANEMDIHDEDGMSLPESEKGEIVIRGHNVMLHYYQNNKANEDSFTNSWFRSGDEGFFKTDSQGDKYFFITGRLKELIIRGGVNVSPLEVDEVIMSIPGVKAGIAVGFENNMYGEEIGAYVQVEEGSSLSTKDILEACAKELPFHKQPKVVIFGDKLPVTSTGKYQRNKLKACFIDYKDSQFRKNK